MAIPVKEKNVKLTVKRDFYDKTNSLKKRTVGEELTVSPDRAEKQSPLGKADNHRLFWQKPLIIFAIPS